MTENWLEIDGSTGEGGGQVVRSSLTLSLLTRRPFRLRNVRAGRSKPGLAAQHLAAVEAAATVGSARVDGAELRSTELTFRPGEGSKGTPTEARHRFDIGTAGAAPLVLQTVLLPLAVGVGSPSGDPDRGGGWEVTVHGGTHVPWSPSFHYLDRVWRPLLEDLGWSFELELVRAGFYPRGGGEIRARGGPLEGPLSPLAPSARGAGRGERRVRGVSGAAELPDHVRRRQRDRARERLERLLPGTPVQVEELELAAASPGSFLVLAVDGNDSRGGFTGLGKRGKPAEQVADEAADQLLEFPEVAEERRTGSPGGRRGPSIEGLPLVDLHLADQLVLPLALAGGRSEVAVERVTSHLLTHLEVARAFLPDATLEVEGAEGEAGLLLVEGAGLLLGH